MQHCFPINKDRTIILRNIKLFQSLFTSFELVGIWSVLMKSLMIKSLTVSLAVAAAIALPTAVKAQADSPSETARQNATYGEQISTEYNGCIYYVGYGWRCW